MHYLGVEQRVSALLVKDARNAVSVKGWLVTNSMPTRENVQQAALQP